MSASPSAVQALIDTYLAPSAAFGALRDKPVWAWLALGLIALITALATMLFLGGMSPEWIVDQQLLAQPEMSDNERRESRDALLAVAPYTGVIGAVFSAISLPILAAALGLVYFLGERVLSSQRNAYGRWFAGAAFSMLPLALGSLGLIVLTLLSAESNVPLDTAQYSSVNRLWLGLTPGESGYALASSADLLYLWCAFLAAVAARVWSGLDWARALLIGALPYLLVFGIWFALV